MSSARVRMLNMVGDDGALKRSMGRLQMAAITDPEFLRHLERGGDGSLAVISEVMPDRSVIGLRLEFVRTPPPPATISGVAPDDDDTDADFEIDDETYRGLDGYIAALKT